ncbi:MAG: ATP-binding protein [Candidatus Dadabacteria bacterium]|nr:ATP-binding protein [Candidatus Dadabacteria bacterium]
MEDFEKLGVFYLGRPYDLNEKRRKEGLVLYDSKDLVTHAVCVGMTGSGKTGLCIGLLEEAAIDGIPSIVIDPKGDLSNLLLTFPDLRGEDFRPWINEDDARSKGFSPEEYANKQAELWKRGLAEWGQDGERIKRLRNASDFAVYTPGSSAGLSVSILSSFAAPDQKIIQDSELMRERISTTATSLLGLLGMEANPIQSREHILLSTILDSAWRQGKNLDLPGIIQQVQTPPVARVGVLELESFFPSKDRFSFAMMVNNLLAAPGFNAWMEGDDLDIGQILYTQQSKPRVSIFSISHLNDAERMFFVSLLLTQILGWMRSQSGTNSLRAIIYMDEIFGYFPPVANPPSKTPLLTLLKQARAFGVGVLLATQNPVDLDYKGLSNTGTWFIGRLQTERDKARVLDGLEGVSGNSGARFDRKKIEETLSSLTTRIFLMNNVHEEEPEIFESRWAMSYLRGPLTRDQIKMLMDPRKPGHTETGKQAPPVTKAVKDEAPTSGRQDRPILPPEVPQYFIPVRVAQPSAGDLVYIPMLLGCGKVYYADAKIGIAADQDASYLLELSQHVSSLDWQQAMEVSFKESDLEKFPADEAIYMDLPGEAGMVKSYGTWSRSFADWLFKNHKIELLRNQGLKAISKPNESERDFRIRLQEASREERDQLAERLRQRYAAKFSGIQERIRRAEQAVAREEEQSKQQKIQTAISFGTTILGAFLGKKRVGVSTLGRATTAMRGVGRTMKESQDIDRAEDTLQVLKKQYADLEAQFKAETEDIAAKFDSQLESLESVEIRPKRSNISVRLIALVWAPYLQGEQGGLIPAWK